MLSFIQIIHSSKNTIIMLFESRKKIISTQLKISQESEDPEL